METAVTEKPTGKPLEVALVGQKSNTLELIFSAASLVVSAVALLAALLPSWIPWNQNYKQLAEFGDMEAQMFMADINYRDHNYLDSIYYYNMLLDRKFEDGPGDSKSMRYRVVAFNNLAVIYSSSEMLDTAQAFSYYEKALLLLKSMTANDINEEYPIQLLMDDIKCDDIVIRNVLETIVRAYKLKNRTTNHLEILENYLGLKWDANTLNSKRVYYRTSYHVLDDYFEHFFLKDDLYCAGIYWSTLDFYATTPALPPDIWSNGYIATGKEPESETDFSFHNGIQPQAGDILFTHFRSRPYTAGTEIVPFYCFRKLPATDQFIDLGYDKQFLNYRDFTNALH